MTVGSAPLERFDQVALEEPLEVLLKHGPSDSRPWLTLLRTPNLDFELVAGLLYSEGLVSNCSDIASIKFCTRGPGAEPLDP